VLITLKFGGPGVVDTSAACRPKGERIQGGCPHFCFWFFFFLVGLEISKKKSVTHMFMNNKHETLAFLLYSENTGCLKSPH
jgi:hypothetical protein